MQDVDGAVAAARPDRSRVPPLIEQRRASQPTLRAAARLRLFDARPAASSAAGGRDWRAGRARAMRTATPLVTWSMISECGAVGDVAGDLDAAVDRARDAGRRRPAWRARRRGASEAEVARVLVEAGQEVAPLPLALQAQHHDHVGAADAAAQVVVDLAPGGRPRRQRGSADRPGGRARRARAARARSSARRGCAGCRRRSPR